MCVYMYAHMFEFSYRNEVNSKIKLQETVKRIISTKVREAPDQYSEG